MKKLDLKPPGNVHSTKAGPQRKSMVTAWRLGSYLETSFEMWLQSEGITGFEREFTFTVGRKWRFDFAWRQQQVAVEIDGLTNRGGSHQNTSRAS